MFEPEAISKVVHEQLVNVPEEHHMAVVTVVNSQGVRIVTAVKLHDEWTIQAYAEAKPHTKLEYGATVQWSR